MSTEKRKLTRAERKLIEAAIARANQTDKKQLSAQDSIPYQRMFPDGICRVTDTFYTKTVPVSYTHLDVYKRQLMKH